MLLQRVSLRSVANDQFGRQAATSDWRAAAFYGGQAQCPYDVGQIDQTTNVANSALLLKAVKNP